MRMVFFDIMVAIFICSGGICIAQSDANIANTSIQFNDKLVHITYDILSEDPEARFEVWLEISESDGRPLKVNALTGDIGPDIQPGKNKVIIWDPNADSIFLDAQIDIQVFATSVGRAKEPNRRAVIMQSVLLPGLGLSRVSGKPHWIKGIIGYGCLGGSIALNKMAVASYHDYGIADSSEDADLLWDTTIRRNNFSKGLAYGAILIWITDLTWTIIGTSDLKKNKSKSDYIGLSLGTDYDNISNAPMISINFIF